MVEYTIRGISPIDKDFKKIKFQYEGEDRHVIVPLSQSVYASIEQEIKRIKDGKYNAQPKQ